MTPLGWVPWQCGCSTVLRPSAARPLPLPTAVFSDPPTCLTLQPACLSMPDDLLQAAAFRRRSKPAPKTKPEALYPEEQFQYAPVYG